MNVKVSGVENLLVHGNQLGLKYNLDLTGKQI